MSQWYYLHGKERHGPVSSRELMELAASGRLHAKDLVWPEGMELNRCEAGEYKTLFPQKSSARHNDHLPSIEASHNGPLGWLDYFLGILESGKKVSIRKEDLRSDDIELLRLLYENLELADNGSIYTIALKARKTTIEAPEEEEPRRPPPGRYGPYDDTSPGWDNSIRAMEDFD